MKTRVFNIHALSALHVGVGQGIGLIDLPIARERSTGLPLIPGSGLKGVLRDELRPDNKGRNVWLSLFGPESADAENDPFAGALMVGDAHLLCLPVRSLAGTFAWVTAPWVLKRYQRDLNLVTDQTPAIPSIEEGTVLLSQNTALKMAENEVVLEDLRMVSTSNSEANTWSEFIAQRIFAGDAAWQQNFNQRFLIMSDDEFNYLAEHATEVRARIKMKEGTRTVAKGALWYEENLPIESLFWGVLGCSNSRYAKHSVDADSLLNSFRENLLEQDSCRLQLGGKATVGRGQVRFLMQEES